MKPMRHENMRSTGEHGISDAIRMKERGGIQGRRFI